MDEPAADEGSCSTTSYHEVRDGIRGRGCFATKSIRAGQEIACCEPLVKAVAPCWTAYACQGCMTSSYPRRLTDVCERCHVARFCSSSSCRALANHHMEACQALAALHAHFKKDEDEMNAWTANASALMLQAFTSLDASLYSNLMSLCSLEGGSQLDHELDKDIQHIIDLVMTCLSSQAKAKAIKVIQSTHSLVTSPEIEEEVAEILANVDFDDDDAVLLADSIKTILLKSECNAFSYWSKDDSYDQLGMGIFLDAAMFNHNCLPSVAKMIDGQRLRFFSLRDIRAGEELYLSYVPIHYDGEARREILFKHFHFDCICERCMMDDLVEEEGGSNNHGSQLILSQKKIIQALAHDDCGGVWIPGLDKKGATCSLCSKTKR